MATVPYEVRSYPGAAEDSVLAGDISPTALGFSLRAGDGPTYPDGTEGPFFVVVDYDNENTEKMHCTSRTGDIFFVDERGSDGTTPLGHTAGAKVRACWTATDAQESNRAASQTVGKIANKGDLLTGSSGNSLVKTAVGADGSILAADSTKPGGVGYTKSFSGLALTSPLIAAGILNAGSTIGGISGTQIAADHATTAATAATVAAGLPVLAGILTANVTNGTVFAIGPLALGTWLVTVTFTAETTTPAGEISITTTPDGGVALTGCQGVVASVAASSFTAFSMTFLATVTAAGSVTLISAVSGGVHLPAAVTTGYTAVKVA